MHGLILVLIISGGIKPTVGRLSLLQDYRVTNSLVPEPTFLILLIFAEKCMYKVNIEKQWEDKAMDRKLNFKT